MSHHKRTLIIISPVYNEEAALPSFVGELKPVLESLQDRYSARCLFVVDRGTDRSVEMLRSMASRDETIQVLALSARFGHQMSLLAGLDHADADAVIMMDSDLQHPPALIPKLLEQFEAGHEIVFTVRQDTQDVGWIRRAASGLYYRLLNSISDVPIAENAPDFRLISRRVADIFRTQIRERNLFLRGLVNWIGFSTVAVPFQAGARQGGQTKYSLARLLRFGLVGVVSFSRKPLRIASLLGLAFAGLGFAYSLLTLIQYLFGSAWPSGWATLVILVSTLSGVQLLCIGILGEYVASIADEVKARPHYLVEDAINIRAQPGRS